MLVTSIEIFLEKSMEKVEAVIMTVSLSFSLTQVRSVTAASTRMRICCQLLYEKLARLQCQQRVQSRSRMQNKTSIGIGRLSVRIFHRGLHWGRKADISLYFWSSEYFFTSGLKVPCSTNILHHGLLVVEFRACSDFWCSSVFILSFDTISNLDTWEEIIATAMLKKCSRLI